MLQSRVYDDDVVTDSDRIWCDSSQESIEAGNALVVVLPPKWDKPAFFIHGDEFDPDEIPPFARCLEGTFRPSHGGYGEFILESPEEV